MTITISVIGCGSISRFHFAAFEKIDARIAWVCDLNEAAAAPYAQKFNARFTKDYKQAIHDPHVQAVFVLTHSSTHKPICIEAIQAGKAIVCEKTLAENPEDSLQITRLAKQNHSFFYTSYMKRYIPALQKAKELLPSLGTLFSTYIRSYQPWGNLWEGNPADGFFHTPTENPSLVVKYYGGGILVCGGSHLLDLIGFLNGRPTRIYAKMHQPQYLDYDLLASALIETPHGVVHFEAAAHPLQKIGFLRDGWDERIEINGTQGRLEIYSALWDQPYYKDSLLLHYDNHSSEVIEYRFGPVSPFEQAVAYYCANIEHGQQGEQPITTGYDVDELIAHIKNSVSLNQAIDVQWRI
jgi:predicted dehydrogenase